MWKLLLLILQLHMNDYLLNNYYIFCGHQMKQLPDFRFTYLIWWKMKDLKILNLCWMLTLRQVFQVLLSIGQCSFTYYFMWCFICQRSEGFYLPSSGQGQYSDGGYKFWFLASTLTPTDFLNNWRLVSCCACLTSKIIHRIIHGMLWIYPQPS